MRESLQRSVSHLPALGLRVKVKMLTDLDMAELAAQAELRKELQTAGFMPPGLALPNAPGSARKQPLR